MRWIAAASAILVATGAGGSVQAQDLSSIETVAFLAGCWAGGAGDLDMREQWTEPEGGIMLGTTRFFRDGRLVDFEFGFLGETEEGVTLLPHPRGEPSEHGFPLVSASEEYVFENLEHDFPVRIIYARDGGDRIAPRIEGHDGDGRGWELQRVPCPG